MFHRQMHSSTKGQQVVFGSQADMQKLLGDKNGNFLRFEQEAAVQYEGFFGDYR